MENNGKIEHRLTRLETQVESILTNHFPHIEKKIDNVVKRQWYIFTTLFSIAVGIIMLLIK